MHIRFGVIALLASAVPAVPVSSEPVLAPHCALYNIKQYFLHIS